MIEKLIEILKGKQLQIAIATMLVPPDTLEKVHRMAGQYQGLQQALDTIDDLMQENEDKP